MSEDGWFTDALDATVAELGAVPRITLASRRGGRGGAGDRPETTTVRLVDHEGVLSVEDTSVGAAAPAAAQRRGGRAGSKTVWTKELAKLERSQVTLALAGIDSRLTPKQGLRRLDDDRLVPISNPPSAGRVLLLVHGTFSNTEALLTGIRANSGGAAFLRWAHGHYDQILSFDHPTMSVSPMLNARALSLLFRGSEASVDVVCHSRGGLVARWWLEAFDTAPATSRRAVFVGSPLAGTGLAAPPNIRHALAMLANVARALGTVAAAAPFLTVVTGVTQVVTSATSLLAKTPAIDAAVALVPGLFAQSRVGNNAEILSLRDAPVAWQNRYFAVQANFESEAVGWKFWKAFRNMSGRAKSTAAHLLFDGANDLVVDTGSMTDLATTVSIGPKQLLDFGTTDVVHHTNYFEQPRTLDFIQQSLR